MGSKLQTQGDDSALLRVTHSNVRSFNAEVRSSLQVTGNCAMILLSWCQTSVESVKEKLWKKCGTSVGSMCLELYDGAGSKISELGDSIKPLGFYSPFDGYILEIQGEVRTLQYLNGGTEIAENQMEDLCAGIKVGSRCQVEPGDKRGVVKYVGKAENLGPGFWVGVQYDEPLGKHDGMVKGTRYFDRPSLHGAMVQPDRVKVCAIL